LKPAYYSLLPEDDRPIGWRKAQEARKKKSCSTPTKTKCTSTSVKGSSKTTPLNKKNASKKPPKAVSDEILPELCKRIGVNGTSSKQKLIKKFVDDFPNTSVRQATIKFSEIVTKTIPRWVSPPQQKRPLHHVYLKPAYYSLILEDDRPIGWRKAQEAKEKKSCSTPS